jgi:hypothetical protein
MIKYSLAMGIRMLCILSLLFVHGWWLVIMAIGAIVLPYIAVVLANVVARPGIGAEAPSGREIMIRDPQAPVIVPPAEEEPSARAGDGRFGQPGEQQQYPQSGDWRYPESSGQQPAAPQSTPRPANEWHFPESSEQRPDAPQSGEQPFPRPAARPFNPPAEGQA